MNHADKAVEYFNNNFNCSQGVFTSFATELGMDEKLALRIGTNFGGGERKGELCGTVVCRKLLGYDLTKAEDMKIIRERNLFRTICPEMIKSAATILDEMIDEGIC